MDIVSIISVIAPLLQICVERDSDAAVDIVRKPNRRQRRVARRRLERNGINYQDARDAIRASRRKDIRRALENCCGVSK